MVLTTADVYIGADQVLIGTDEVVLPWLTDYPTIQAVLDSSVRRSGAYFEAAPRNPQVSTFANSPLAWCTARKEQLVHEYFGPGIENVTHTSVCRMGNMRQALAVAASDGAEYGTGESAVVVVRVQSDAEGWGPAYIAHQGPEIIRDVCLISAYNPLLFANPLAQEEQYLVLAVWYGADPNSKTALYVSSDNAHQTWTKVWESTTGRIRTPRLTQSPTGATYLFFRDSLDDNLKFYTRQDAPSLWGSTLTWDNPTATAMWGLSGRAFDIRADRAMWVYASAGSNATEVRYSTDPDPSVTGSWVTQTDTGIPAAPEWVRVARAGGLDAFGQWPPDTVMVVQGNGTLTPAVYYKRYIANPVVGTITGVEGAGYFPLPRHTGIWQHAEIDGYGFRWKAGDTTRIIEGQDVNALTNRHLFNYRKTPSTYIATGNDPGGIGQYVELDTRGPLVGDEDAVDVFPLFWTKSGPNFSAAFPPFTVGVDMECDFSIQFPNGQYHNTWFVIADPLQPDRPVFKADYYVGNATEGGGHPHDNARGLAMWLAKGQWDRHPQKTPQDAERGTFCEQYRHPLTHMFQGYDDPADNERPWLFRLKYIAADDVFELYWWDEGGDVFVPFVPYLGPGLGDREFVDVGPNGEADEYVASPTELYWRQPRAGLWPRQIIVGCPEVKPAIERQSTIRVGEIKVRQDVTVPRIAPTGAPCLIPRMSGSFDLFYVEGDALFRQTAGHGFSDLMGVESFRSSHTMDAGPDQASLTVLAVDNYRGGRAVENLHDHHLLAYAVGGYRSRAGSPTYEAGGAWGDWRCLFFGTSDTSNEQDSQDSPRIQAAFYSPIRELARHHGTQGFTNEEPLEATDDDTGEPLGEPDEVAMRQTAVIFMTDFNEPCNQSLPVDSKGRLMRYEDYITRFVWEDMLRLDPARLDLERVGFQPTSYTINSSAGDANLLESIQPLWESLGLHWWYDFHPDDGTTLSRIGGGIFRVWRGGNTANFDPNREPDLVLKGRTSLALPLGLPTSDFARAGNVVTTVSNLESRPNHAVARPAPWPDGADTIEVGIEWQNGRPSQHAFVGMYQFGMPGNFLRREWASARMLSVPVQAAPYFRPGLLVDVEIEVDQPPNVSARFTRLEGRYFVWGTDHEVSPSSLSANVLLRPVQEFSL